jgi:hypothetical protein
MCRLVWCSLLLTENHLKKYEVDQESPELKIRAFKAAESFRR